MTWFNVQVQLDLPAARLDDDLTDALLEDLEDFHTSLSSHDGLITARLSLQAAGLSQATRQAIAVTEQAAASAGSPAQAVAVTAMTEQEFTSREGWPQAPTALPEAQAAPQPDMTLKEASLLLGITRQAVTRRLLLPVDHPDHLRGFRDDTRRWHVEAIDVRRAAQRREQTSSAGTASPGTDSNPAPADEATAAAEASAGAMVEHQDHPHDGEVAGRSQAPAARRARPRRAAGTAAS
ncbi:hypothetical protein [Kineococcus rhizosphaerae]|uniref:Uncharacterized protein n=1 Tax=Kineococcus rhizosphaerae TaxID=559628 RepID=A0A2T0QPZ4_9ACTN|nr:hypothetical protein [Kineococcus rhizosphaerae]PRY06790.1 hypothetical protein CLV37_1324 [Kineococcus rhizosphaerae]